MACRRIGIDWFGNNDEEFLDSIILATEKVEKRL
jgi:hypothetical protein